MMTNRAVACLVQRALMALIFCVCAANALDASAQEPVVAPRDTLTHKAKRDSVFTPVSKDSIADMPIIAPKDSIDKVSKIDDIVIASKDAQQEQKKPVAVAEKVFKPSSKKALLFSIIPGGGQIYNRKYWKLPIIAGAYTACYYAITWNNNNLQEYAIAYRDIKSDKPLENRSWTDFLPLNVNPEDYINNTNFQDRLRRGRDFFRRNRDLSIIVTVGVYLIVMIDAYVDAELYNFDISPNVSLSYAPMINLPTPQNPVSSYGVNLAFTF